MADPPVLNNSLVVAMSALDDGELDGVVGRRRFDLWRGKGSSCRKCPQEVVTSFQPASAKPTKYVISTAI